ncbi:barstar family protein [Chryseobacterium sp. SSA4.19]|uniref:barstar family protein n=1 Tax=Chryseobacterium sp. SSA4.19 TaxID=2919915 RepID=UPI001F4DFDED|nr:barstar family protein [Chryseobacterium sp. SSA4.19]MCJ8155491.1 barstar family protein [Chryseobacterium sp. SSA4.19]
MFAFSLDTKEETDIITYIDDVKNLESSKSNMGYRELRLINVHEIENLKYKIEESIKIYDNQGFIHLLDENNSIVTSTFISNIRIIKSKHHNITLSGYVWFTPRGFHKAWQMYLDNKITEKNIWKTFNKDELQGWIVFTGCLQKPQIYKENLIINIDGNNFHNLDGFYCSIGEEVNGIAGYFGRQLYSFYNCLHGDFGVKCILKVIWTNHLRSKKLLKNNYNKIIDIFKKYNIKVILK